MKISKRKILNPLTGKYMSFADTAVMALIVHKTYDLIDFWQRRAPSVPLQEFLLSVDNNAPLKGAKNKFVGKRYSGVVSILVAMWQEEIDKYNTFDMYLEHLYQRASGTPKIINN